MDHNPYSPPASTVTDVINADQYAQHLFKSAYHDHVAGGGRAGSWLSVIGVSLLSVLILFGILFALILAVPSLFKGL